MWLVIFWFNACYRLRIFFLSVHLCASANVTFGWAISTIAVTDLVMRNYTQKREVLPSNTRTPYELVAIDSSKMVDYFINS
jgi:hypothetical protein